MVSYTLVAMVAASIYYAEIPMERSTMIEKNQLREMITEVLATCPRQNLNTPAAIELLMLTAATESKLGTYMRQIKGPARGIMQMEPATEQDIFDNFLRYPRNLDLLLWVDELRGHSKLALKFNIAYQIAMARIHYLRSPMKMPTESDIQGLGKKWKQVFNTSLGKGTVEKAIRDYQTYAI